MENDATEEDNTLILLAKICHSNSAIYKGNCHAKSVSLFS